MRRVLSLFLAVLMILTVQVPVAFAANIENVKTVTDGVLPSGMTASYWTASQADGFGGKDADDKVIKLTTTVGESDPFISGAGAMATTDNKTFKKYFVTRFNFYTGQENRLYLRSANNNQVINKITSSSYKLNEWNSVVIYLDFTKINPDFDYDSITQPTEALKSIPEQYRSEICPAGFAYVNGVKVDENFYSSRLQDRFGMINTYYHPTEVTKYLNGELSSISKKGPESNVDWRLGFNPTDKTKEEVGYIDDLYTYYTDELPDTTMPTIKSNDKVTAGANNVLSVIDDTTRVSQLSCESGYSIVAYSDVECTTKLSSSAKLEEGNIVIVKDSYGQMTKYTVSMNQTEESSIEIIKSMTNGELPTGVTATDGWTASQADGFDGKDADDKVLKLTTQIGQSDAFLSGAGAMATTDNKTFKKYFVTRFNFYPKQGNNLFLRTANNAYVVDFIKSSSYKLNEWNSVVIYVDFTKINPDFNYDPITQPTEELKSIPEEYRPEICPAGFAYVNGVKVDSDYYASRLQDRFGMKNTYYHPTNVNKYLAGEIDSISKTGPESNNQWRLGFNPTDKTKEEVGYIDDLYTYYTDELPDTSIPEIKSSESITVTEDNTLIIYNENMTVAELPVAEDEFIVAYSDADFTTALSPTATLTDGNVIIVKDDFDQMTKYTVSVEQRNVASVTSTQTEIIARANLYEATLILAGYDDKGNLAEVKCSSDNGFNSLSVSGLCYSAKAFVLDSLKTLKPLGKNTEFEQQISVACWGDSITKGQGSSGDAYAYPGVLAKLTGYNVINMGVGGETATSVAARQGGIEIRLDKDITIPETGSVDIEFSGYFKDGTYAGVVTPRTTAGGWNPCYINGIEGTLSFEIDQSASPDILKWAKFTRKESGESVDVPKGSVMTVEANKTKTHINVFMLNANGGWNDKNTPGAKNDQIQDHIKLFENMIANTPDNEKFIILGLTIDGNWDVSHDALKEKYGDKFLNIKEYLATEQALQDALITPTEDDLSRISAGNIPSSFLTSDGVHLNDAGYERIGNKVYEKMQELGYAEKSMVKCWPEYKRKALTIGFDDCVKTDDMVIEMLNDAGVPGTFNIVASYLSSVDDETLKRYEGHEIANHSQTHLKDVSVDTFEDVKGDVAQGQKTLEDRFPNHDIFGFAVPAKYYSPELLNWLKSEESGLKYSRTDPGAATSVSLNYELPEDWYLWTPTHTLKGIGSYRGVDYIDDFFNELNVKDSDTLKILFTWGHPIYFVYPDWASDKTEGPVSLENLERILDEYKEHSSEVWAATHGQVYNYANALDNLVIDKKNDTIYNPSDIDVYLIIGGEETLIKAGETVNY